jgi:iron(III) transport system substrate-binding protein
MKFATVGPSGVRLKRAAIVIVWALFLSFISSLTHAQVKPNWKSEWGAILGKAKQEGKVVVWGPPGQQVRQAMVDGFKKAFPEISIEYQGGTNDLRVKLISERRAGIYAVDVYMTGADGMTTQIKPAKAVEPLRPALVLPEVTDPKFWREQRHDFVDTEQQYILAFVNQTSPVAGYDFKQVKPGEIDNLYDLLDAKWKGKIILGDPLIPGAASTWFRWAWHVLGPEKATDFFRRLRSQTGTISRDLRRQVEWVAQGRYAILISPSLIVGQQLLNEGVQFGMLWDFKDYGSWITSTTGNVALLNRAPNPNAGTVFINWILGREGQTLLSKATNQVSRRTDVPTDHLPEGVIPKAGVKYWKSYVEEVQIRSPEEEAVMKEVFGR